MNPEHVGLARLVEFAFWGVLALVVIDAAGGGPIVAFIAGGVVARYVVGR